MPPEFEKNTRIFVKGNVLDEKGIPIDKARIIVNTATGYYFSLYGPSDRDFLLGENFSQSNGDFSVFSLFDRDEDFNIAIDAGEVFSNYIYRVDTEDYIPSDFTFDLGDIKLSRRAEVTFNITRSSPLGTKFRFSFRFSSPNYVAYYIGDDLDEEKTKFSNILEQSFFLDENESEISGNINSLLGSEVIFTYQVNDDSEKSETFIINTEDYEFNFSY